MSEHRKDPDTLSWGDLKRDFEFTPAERAEISAGVQRLIAEVRAFRLSEMR